MRLLLEQMRVHPGDPGRNARAMLKTLEACRGEADLVAFPELCVPGYFVGDRWERPAFLAECARWNEALIAATADGPALAFGTVACDPKRKGEDGRPRKYNAVVVAQGGAARVHAVTRLPFGTKTLLPNYREFEDTRHFYDTRRLAAERECSWTDLLTVHDLELGGRTWRLGFILCEDAWEDDYSQKPVEALKEAGCEALINLSCSPFTLGKNGKRNRVFSERARRLSLPMAYVNCIGLQDNAKTVYTFDGRSTAYADDGSIAVEAPAYAETALSLRWEMGATGRVQTHSPGPAPGAAAGADPARDRMRELHAALRYGAETFLESIGVGKVVIGVSGGIDSAVSAALYRSFLPRESVLLVNMPSAFNSATTIGLARELAARLDCLYAEIPIGSAVEATAAQLSAVEARSPAGGQEDGVVLRLDVSGPVLENIQARDRGARLLAGVAAAFGGVFACNTNKAEMTVGYGTLYGDIAGHLCALGDLWKGDVYALGRWLNEEAYRREVIPEGIFTVKPSAELSAAQAVDEGKGDPLIYPYHDRLFFAFVQRWNRASPEDMLDWYAEGSLNRELGLPEGIDAYALFPDAAAFCADLERWWRLYTGLGVVKRVQAPPVLAVSSRAFGFDHRDSLGAAPLSETYLEKKTELLGR